MFKAITRFFSSVPAVPVSTPAPIVAQLPSDRKLTTGPVVAFVNNSTVVTDDQVAECVAALQIQIDRDFAPIWELGANLLMVRKGEVAPADAWVMYILDHSDQAGALGYHDLTPAGMPTGKVFAADDLKYNLSWTVTVSHELMEMLLDPYINYVVFAQQTNTTGYLFALEVADAVEDDSLGYRINGVLVSDFVTPAWFMASAPKTAKFSFRDSVHAPFELAPGGYIGYFEVGSSTTGWQQETHASGPGKRLLARGKDSRLAKVCEAQYPKTIVMGKNTFKR